MASANFSNSIRRSIEAFDAVVAPHLLEVLGGSFVSVESSTHTDSLHRILDNRAGIDMWHIHPDGIRGVANRVQFGPTCWGSFTVRAKRDNQDPAKTEYYKRKEAIRLGYLYPTLTFQSYVGDLGDLLGVAVTRTQSIIGMIDNGKATLKHTGGSQMGQASFYTVAWADMVKLGYPIYYYMAGSVGKNGGSRGNTIISLVVNTLENEPTVPATPYAFDSGVITALNARRVAANSFDTTASSNTATTIETNTIKAG